MKRMIVVVIASVAIAGIAYAESGTKGKPLTMQQKTMMKNGAMKNMDKVMAEMPMSKRPMYMMKKQAESNARGKALFESTALGANGRSCATCHPGGQTIGGAVETPMPSKATGKPYKLPVPSLVGAAATFPKYKVPNDAVITLEEMNNNCIMMFEMAQPLELGSEDARDLASYVSSLSNDTPVAVGKMKMMSMDKKMDGKGKKKKKMKKH